MNTKSIETMETEQITIMDDQKERIIELKALKLELESVSLNFAKYVEAICDENEPKIPIYNILSRIDAIADRLLWCEVDL